MEARSLLAMRVGRVVAIAALVAVTAGPATAGDVVATDHTVAERDVSALIADVFVEMGLAPETAAALTTGLDREVAERLNELVSRGLLTLEQVDELRRVVADGEFREHLSPVAGEARFRRDAFRAAAEKALGELGIDVPDGMTIHAVLELNDLTPDDLAHALKALGLELPPPPVPPPGPDPHDPTIEPVLEPGGQVDDDGPLPLDDPYPTTKPPPPPAEEPKDYPLVGPDLGEAPKPPPPPEDELHPPPDEPLPGTEPHPHDKPLA